MQHSIFSGSITDAGALLHRLRSRAITAALCAALMAGAMVGAAAQAAEPSAPVFEYLAVAGGYPPINPDDPDFGPAFEFTATDEDGLREVSATWCHIEQPQVCITATTGELAPDTTRLWNTWVRRDVAPDAVLGTYRLQEVRISNYAGESTVFLPDGTASSSPAGIAGPTTHDYDLDKDFVVADHTAPELVGFSWHGPGGNIAVPGEPIQLDVQVADDWRDPVRVVATVRPRTYGASVFLRGTLVGDGQHPVSGTIQATDPFDPPGGPSGEWIIESISVGDSAGNGTTYWFDGTMIRDEYRNQVGTHDFDLASAPLTVRSPYPNAVRATAIADSTLEVHWESAVDGDGGPPQEYEVVVRPWVDDINYCSDTYGAYPDLHAMPAITQTVPGSDDTARFTGLENGDKYLFEVTSRMPDGRRYYTRANSPFRPKPDLTVSPQASVVEGDSGVAYAVLAARLSSPTSCPVYLDYRTEEGTATGEDFTPTAYSERLISPGDLTGEIRVPVNGDTVDETDEEFHLRITGATNARPVLDTSAITILDDDPAPGSPLAIGSVTSVGGKAGTSPAAFTVRLARPLRHAVSVSYRTQDRTAVAGRDYAATGGTLRFKPGVLARYIRVPVYARPRTTADSTFMVQLRHPEGTGVTRSRGWGRIRR
jgi:hypothetical protein